MCICDLLIYKSVWSPADPAIPSSSVYVIIMIVHIFITYCLFAAFCQLSIIGHNVYGMLLCIAYLNVITFVHVCFLSPFIARISLHFICGECVMMFQYSVYWIICMLHELVPEIFSAVMGVILRYLLFLVTMQTAIVIQLLYDLLLWW